MDELSCDAGRYFSFGVAGRNLLNNDKFNGQAVVILQTVRLRADRSLSWFQVNPFIGLLGRQACTCIELGSFQSDLANLGL